MSSQLEDAFNEAVERRIREMQTEHGVLLDQIRELHQENERLRAASPDEQLREALHEIVRQVKEYPARSPTGIMVRDDIAGMVDGTACLALAAADRRSPGRGDEAMSGHLDGPPPGPPDPPYIEGDLGAPSAEEFVHKRRSARAMSTTPDERLREALRDANEYLAQIADYSPSEVADAIDSVRAQIKDALAATDVPGKLDRTVLDPETGIEEPVTTGRIPDAEFVEPPLMPPAASPDERLREALREIEAALRDKARPFTDEQLPTYVLGLPDVMEVVRFVLAVPARPLPSWTGTQDALAAAADREAPEEAHAPHGDRPAHERGGRA